MLCDYGCGQEAKYQFKNGKWCCSEYHSSCPIVRNKRSMAGEKNPMFGKKHSKETLDKIKLKVTEALSNPEVRSKISNANKGNIPWNKGKVGVYSDESLAKMRSHKKPPKYTHCIVCNKPTKYSNYCRSCGVKKGKTEWPKLYNNINNDLCSYGCGKIAKYIYSNNSMVCSKGQKCPELRKRSRIRVLKTTPETYPNYNPEACKLIDEYGKENNYNFQHAENGGEFHVSGLGYWVDGYDKEKNVVIEIDESFHFDNDGNLKERDIIRQKEIIKHLKCEFIRLRSKCYNGS